MKRDVKVASDRVVVKPLAADAATKVQSLKLQERVAAGGRLTDAERDLVLIALLQHVVR